MSEASHENIIQIVYAKIDAPFIDHNQRTSSVVYYVMKYAEYGELFNFITQTPIFSEKIARYYFH